MEQIEFNFKGFDVQDPGPQGSLQDVWLDTLTHSARNVSPHELFQDY